MRRLAREELEPGWIEFGGYEFPIPDTAEELGITHAVCCVHLLRGPFVHRWMRSNQAKYGIEISAFVLYGSAVTRPQYIAVCT
jgi:hypothetical protein